MNNELIQTKEDLIHYLTTKRIASKFPPEYVYVSTKLRKLVLTDPQQGNFIHQGKHKCFDFENFGGGVYIARIRA